MKQILNPSSSYAYSIGFLTLIIFAVLRPILPVLAGKVGIPIHIAVPLFLSYLLLIILLGTLIKVRPNVGTLEILIIIFCVYVLYSAAWGSSFDNLARMTLPFVAFFAARTFLDSPRKVRLVIFALIIGYIIPIAGSSFMIFKGATIGKIDFYSKVERHLGLYSNIHSCAHAMGFFTVLFAFFLENRENIPALRKYIVYITFVLSIYCMWNTYTRSVYLGYFIFWGSYFFIWRKRYFLIFSSGALTFMILKLSTLRNIFFKAQGFNLDGASSGRITLWSHNLKLFLEWPFYIKMLGGGLGTESGSVIGGQYDVWSSHNDWVSLLVTVGVIGLLLYGAIIFTLVREIIRSNLERRTKALFLSTVLMFISISAFTNGYIGRFEMSQSFWLLMGFFYCFRTTEFGGTRKTGYSP